MKRPDVGRRAETLRKQKLAPDHSHRYKALVSQQREDLNYVFYK